jgi:serine/threonine-protein kinase
MAPEQFAGRGVCAATDIWALGMIAYTLLVGDCYWVEESETADSVFAFATRVSFGPPERASSRAARLQRWLPPEFDAWFARATAVEPKARFQRATEATRALAEALGVGHLAPAPPAPVALAETAPGDEVASADPGVGESPEERPDADGPPEPAQAPVHDAMRERPGTWAAVVGIAVVGVSVVAVVTMVWIARGRARVAAASSAAASAPGVVELVPFTAPLGPGDPKAGVPGADRVPAGSSSVAAATAAASSIAPARSAAARGSAAKAPQTSAIPSAGGSAAQPPKQPKYTRD